MSNIYIQEPPTNGKVLIKTTVGDIDVELWSKEAPKTCRNFVQLCLEGYYDSTAFHRVVKEFIVQGGDPTDTGEGGESIYGAPFKDEFHSRLRFVRRGLVAMANGGPHDNGSQFFFTMAATPELQNKHTIFGKVVGDTLFNMLKLQEVELETNSEQPQDPHKILMTEVLNNPYDDIVPRQIKRVKKEKDDEKKIKSKSKATKNFSLLSFGDEAEDDEEQVDKATESFRGKSKSSHDLTDDPRLSSVPAVEKEKAEEEKRKKKGEGSPDEGKTKKSETEEGETRVKPEPAEDEIMKKAESPPEETKKEKPETKEEDKRKRHFDQTETPEKKKSPVVDEEEPAKKRKMESEEEGKKTLKEETKEDTRKKKSESESSHDNSRKRKTEDWHKDDRKKRSREREEDDRRKRKEDGKEEDGRRKRKGEEEKDEGKKKPKLETETAQPPAADKTPKDDSRHKVKKETENSPRGKESKSMSGFMEESKQNRMEELKKEQRKLQRDIKDFKKRSQPHDKVKVETEEVEETTERNEDDKEDNDLLAIVKKERQKYKQRKKQLGRRENREDATLAMLAEFQNKLAAARTVAGDYDDVDEEKPAGEDEEDDAEDMSWMRHKLHFEEESSKKVIDANVHDDDRFTISDPRNPLNQRRRERSKKAMREKR